MSGDLSGFSMFDLFREEARTHGETISRGLVDLENAPGDEELVARLMRAAHSLKGAARIVGLDVAVAIAHAMEDALVAVQKGQAVITPTRIDQLLRGSDLLAQLIQLEESQTDEWSLAHVADADALATDLRTPVTDQPRPAAEATGPTDATVESGPPPRVRDDAAIKVTPRRLDRIMRLAGESLIESRRFQTVRDRLNTLRRRHRDLQSDLREASARTGRDLESAMASLRRQAARSERELAEHQDELEVFLGRLEERADALYEEVLGSRMRPFEEGVVMFPRMVRDLARDLGKQAVIRIEGAEVPVDRDVLRDLEAPLTHMLRNCVDHGVEAPSDRRARDKEEQATIVIAARHQAGRLEVSVSDDGRGIDPEGIRRRVIQRGLIDAGVAASLSSAELYEFLFLPGFSTAAEVTEVSGRGVGLDVVQTMVREISGSVRIESEPGRGTRFRLTLPVTRSVVRALIADIGGEAYAMSLTHIKRISRHRDADIVRRDHRRLLRTDEGELDLMDSGEILELDPVRLTRNLEVIVIEDQDRTFGFVVDAFLGEEDLLIRPLDPRLGRIPHVSAAAFREDGEPVLLLNAEDLLRSARRAVAHEHPRPVIAGIEATRSDARRILVVDDSMTVREAQRGILTRLGFEVELAVDGHDGWDHLQRGSYDLLITDVDMPGMNGIELIQTVRSTRRFDDLPIIVISYKDDPAQRQIGLDAGAERYLSKHVINDPEFVETVRSLLPA